MIQAKLSKRKLQFRFEAKTSRGSLFVKEVFFVAVFDTARPDCFGLGEAAPLEKLSRDALPDFEQKAEAVCARFNDLRLATLEQAPLAFAKSLVPAALPSLRFAFEVALLDFSKGGQGKVFPNAFHAGKLQLPINGLIWMGKAAMMKEQITAKLSEGYDCIKMKIGAIDWPAEKALLESIRAKFPKEQITLRVDANGAFGEDKLWEVLADLQTLDIHSIEQPVRPDNVALLQAACARKLVPIALDEQLIGDYDAVGKRLLLEKLKPQYIVLKPTLLGGIAETQAWIATAKEMGIGWWITSALESNVGLNAICQLTAQYPIDMPQGLGTGKLFKNNVGSPLYLKEGYIGYDPKCPWEDPRA